MSTTWWILLGILLAIMGILYQMEHEDVEVLLAEKTVALSKTRIKIFQYIADLRTYAQWYPTAVSFDPTDTAPMSVGKHFTEVHYMPLLGALAYDSIVTGYESPRYVSFLTDTVFDLRTEMSVERVEAPMAQSKLVYRLYSRRRSYLFRMFYSHRARQAMFNLRFLMQG